MALRVFFVEDAENMLSLMKELCHGLGEIEIVATSGTEAEAIDWLEKNPGGWDVAVLDLVLSQGSGINLVSRARATHKSGQIAVFSGYATPGCPCPMSGWPTQLYGSQSGMRPACHSRAWI